MGIGRDIPLRAAIADKGYSSKANRAAARKRGIAPAIPRKDDEKETPGGFAKILYEAHARIETCFGRLKRSKRVALKCKKRRQVQINCLFRRRPMLDQIRARALSKLLQVCRLDYG